MRIWRRLLSARIVKLLGEAYRTLKGASSRHGVLRGQVSCASRWSEEGGIKLYLEAGGCFQKKKRFGKRTERAGYVIVSRCWGSEIEKEVLEMMKANFWQRVKWDNLVERAFRDVPGCDHLQHGKSNA